MNNYNMKIKMIFKSFFFSGLIFAGLSAGFDYSDGQEFRVWKFVLDVLFFGFMMVSFEWYQK